MKNRVFFPQTLLNVLMDAGGIDIDDEELLLTEAKSRYRVVEAVRVLREITDGADPHDLCGKVKSRAYLNELGAELMGDSMIVEDKAYDVLAGFVGVPIGDLPADGGDDEAILRKLAEAVT
jgi:hypothetical protein